ncbi:MAG TPA: methyltransferase domain-containing protein [Candidatus Paceibacterota bacterium]|jgi:SAM-dependent methyltransferase|nr:methyltransferase domain-containing protein [Candidatus Paceibacterota bacterium]
MRFKTKSFLRRAEYARLAQITVEGAILDVGGSKKSGYHELIGGKHVITTGNIDAAYGADVLFDAQQAWPFEEGSFDCVLFMNVLEHLYRYDKAVSEAYRVLRVGGRVVGVVPFMFNVHGSPNDYFRYTRSMLEQMFAERGFADAHIEELGTGAFSVIYHALIGFVRWNWLADVLIPAASGLDYLVARVKPGNKMSAAHMPLGYYFEATRGE